MAYSLPIVTEKPGANPAFAYGNVTLGDGLPAVPNALGTVLKGDDNSEFTFVKLVLAAATVLREGQFYLWDKDYTATILSTTSAALGRGKSVGVCRYDSPTALAAGTYYFWMQTKGQVPMRNSLASVTNALTETTATSGEILGKASPTSGSYAVFNVFLLTTANSFTADMVTSSAILRNVSTFNDIALGATIAGTGIPAATTISAMDRVAKTITMSGATTVGGTAVTVTTSLTTTGNMPAPPYVGVLNQ